MTDKIVVLSSCETLLEAELIAGLLVERRLAACVNIVGGVRSVYRWNDKVEKAEEYLLAIKTNRALLGEVRAAIEKAHSYELPECIALPIIDGSAPYLAWLDASVNAQPGGSGGK